jgi:NADH dehydrogenase
MDYDILVLATGADTNFFGNSKLMENAFPMKATVEALQIRHRLIQNFEDAVLAKTPEELQKYLTIVLVGGGPTGVELGGAIAEMKNYTLPKDYPEIDFNKMKIYLLEGSQKTLGSMSAKSSAESRIYLEKLGVTVMTGTVVKDYDGNVVTLQDGKTIGSYMVIWAAGIRGNVPGGINPDLIVKGNRIKTDRFNKIIGFENIYAIGDVAYMETPKYAQGHPQVASVAIQQGSLLAKNLFKLRSGKGRMEEFEYHDKGSMATVGRNLAVVDIPHPKLHFKGLLAWLIWMSLHLMLILGVKNRLFVFLNWLYNYVTHDQSLRLLFKDFYRQKKPVG